MKPLPATAPARSARADVSLDALEWWITDLDRTRRMLTTIYGFAPTEPPLDPDGEGGQVLELANGGVRIVLRHDSTGTGPVGRHVAEHGDTIADVTLSCPDPATVARRAAEHGLRVSGPAHAPTIDLFGDRTVRHTLRHTGPVPVPAPADRDAGMVMVDHVAYCVPWGLAEPAARAYEHVFGLRRVDADSFDAIGDETIGMRSIVLRSGSGFTVVLTEPLSRTSAGQTRRFVDDHAGPGVQHTALAVDDLFTAVAELRRRGAEFLPIPGHYYDRTQRRLPDLPIPWPDLRQLEILVDADHDGLLYQLFTRPLTDRGTFFFELIQRHGATGFGVNNVRALFEAVQATISEEP
jgi:4-hydroxymandelate synthase